MDALLVMTIIGRDRPGLVDSVAQAVVAHGGNWLESRMSRLGGQFAGILRVQVPADRQPGLEGALRELGVAGLTVVVHRDEPQTAGPGAESTILEVVGQDRPGIVRQIAQALAEAGVNVEALESECSSAAMSGEAIFKAKFRVALPASCALAELRQRIEQIAADLIVDVNFGESC